MHMIFRAANGDGCTTQIGENAAKITVQFTAQIFVAQKGLAVLCGKYGVDENIREGLWHRMRMEGVAWKFNPFEVDLSERGKGRGEKRGKKGAGMTAATLETFFQREREDFKPPKPNRICSANVFRENVP